MFYRVCSGCKPSLAEGQLVTLLKPLGKVSISTYIPHRYGQHVLKIFRQAEHLIRQIETTLCHIDFLTTCLHHGLIPKFLLFKLYNHRHINQGHTKKFQETLLIKELKQQRQQLDNLHSQKESKLSIKT